MGLDPIGKGSNPMQKRLSRRTFAKTTAALSACALFGPTLTAAEEKPNILWITSEDNGPQLGCYGDTYATTPHLDALAKKGIIFRHAWSNAPVCAPARTTIITGMYPTSLGAEHMRSMVHLPSDIKMFPQYLREAGYYCTNNAKEDYNLYKPDGVWDDSSTKAHWRNRQPGQPFFSVFNFTTTHESQIRKRPHTPVHDPDQVRVPAYHPDTPEVRQDWAQYYDKITEMDRQVGQILAQLEEDGLAQSTIVFYYGDHGAGMPRSKRWPYNSGLHVPVILHIPEKFKHLAPAEYQTGGESRRLIGFVDLAPTVLRLAGITPPPHMQGEAFAGPHTTPNPRYQFGFRGRMDERYDLVRSVSDGRFVYIRNFMPHKIYGQHINYMFQTPTTQVWKRLFDEGKLPTAQAAFWESKPPEELYDLQSDPDETINLASDPQFESIRQTLNQELLQWQRDFRDVGLLPENEIHSRAEDSTPFQVGHNKKLYPLLRIQRIADLASNLRPDALPELHKALYDPDSAVRYWGALGILMRKTPAIEASQALLQKALSDPAPSVRIATAQALGQYGGKEDVALALPVLLALAPIDQNGVYLSMMALNAIESMGPRAQTIQDKLAALPQKAEGTHPRLAEYVPRLLEHLQP
jgi:uncharacterized sulfatase